MRVCRALPLVCLLSTLMFAVVPDRVTQAIDASQAVELARSVHPKARAQYDQGRVKPDFQLGYVTLQTSPAASQQRAINQLLAEQQDPFSPNYHKWLTPEQYAGRFGMSQNDINSITAWLEAQGFTVLSVPRGRNSIIVSGMAYQFENAFQTEIHRYNVNGELHYANATPLKVPVALSGVVTSVRGLNDFRMKPMNLRKRVHPEYYDSSLQFTFLAPGDIKTLYDIAPLYTAGIDGTGQKLAVVGQTDIYLADINYFRSGFGLSQIGGCTNNANGVVTACNTTNFRYVLVGTETGTPSKCGDLSEADLDIEWSGATARNAQIIYVNSPLVWNTGCTAPTNSNGGVEAALADAINNNYAPVISMSYGICEAQAYDHEAELQQANLEGITVLNSSGDTSAAGCDNFTNNTTPPNLATGGLAVGYPASSPEVTGVGGTAVPFADTGSPYWGTANGSDGGSLMPPPPQLPEQSWNDPAEFAAYCAGPGSGGNFCTHYHITSALTAQEALGLGGGGGGASNCYSQNQTTGVCQAGFPQPAWQQGLQVAGAPANVRYVPDISLLASPNFTGYIYCTPKSELGGSGSTSSCASGIPGALAGCATSGGLCSVVGGTSASTPVFAGMVALLNQYFQGTSSAGLGNINPMLYKLAKLSNGSATPVFHQLTGASSSNNNVVYCAGGTPSIQPAALQCPGATGTIGTIGYQASNFDANTGYNLVTGLGSVDAYNLAQAWTASRSSSTTSLSTSTSSTYEGQSVTLTATVTPAVATGTVKFSSGSTSLGTATLSNGTATLATTSLPIGTDNITATYQGDVDYSSSTSSAVGVTVVAAYTLSAPDISVTQGNSGTSTVTVTPAAGFTSAITFSCSDPASESTCSFSPASITPPNQTTTTLTVTTTAATARLLSPFERQSKYFFALLLPGMLGIVFTAGSRKRYSKSLRLLSFVIVLGCSTLWLGACGGGGSSGNPGTPKGTYNITVTAISGSISHNVTIKLAVN